MSAWAGTTKHLCKLCEKEKASLTEAWLRYVPNKAGEQEARAAMKAKKKYYRAFHPDVMRKYEERFPYVSAQMSVIFLHRTGIDLNLCNLFNYLIPKGVSPNLLATALTVVRDAHKDRLQLAHYSFQEVSAARSREAISFSKTSQSPPVQVHSCSHSPADSIMMHDDVM
jgi:hypothetical protein